MWQYESLPVYLQDIQNGTVHQTFLGKECEILEVYCWTVGFHDRWVVYETDLGTYVRYYASDKSQAIEYGWEEFKEYSLAYQAYIQSFYDENGNYLGHGSSNLSGIFHEFVEEYKAQKEAARLAELEAARQRTIWIAVSVGAVVVLAAGVAILLYTKKRKNPATQV